MVLLAYELPGYRLMPHKVLIVEDDDATRNGLSALLGAAGYDPLAVSTVEAAFQALSDERPDLLICDIRLEGDNGLQLVAMSRRRIPAIVVTGFADAGLESEAHDLGADYLVKPVAPSVLLARIEHRLSVPQAALGTTYPRRWDRKNVKTPFNARADTAFARVLDVSYGGVCLEVRRPPGEWQPLAFDLSFPDIDLCVRVEVVWTRRAGNATWLCGAAIVSHDQRWRALVDSVA